jgi:dTDP-glucose 4,6-dehydratase
LFTPSLFPEDLDHVLARTRDDWQELRGQRLFMTGGTGFFGMWLLETFLWANQELELGAEVLVLSRDPAAFLRKSPHLAGHPALSFHTGDVTSFEFPEGHFSHVMHAATAASAALNAESPLIMVDTIVGGTRRTLEFARQSGVRKFLLTSSGAVYGRQPADVVHVPEEYRGGPDPLDAASAYGEAKRLAEHLCCLYARSFGIEAKISRGFAFIGPYLPLNAHFAIGNFIRDALAGDAIAVGGDGTPLRSYLYAADLAIWLWKILFHGTSCRAYNTGSDVEISIADLARAVAKELSSHAEVRIARPATSGQPRQVYVPQTRRAREELGLDLCIPLDEAIRRTGLWHRALQQGRPDALQPGKAKNDQS